MTYFRISKLDKIAGGHTLQKVREEIASRSTQPAVEDYIELILAKEWSHIQEENADPKPAEEADWNTIINEIKTNRYPTLKSPNYSKTVAYGSLLRKQNGEKNWYQLPGESYHSFPEKKK